MMQFAALLNELTPSGAEQFAKFLDTATSSDASRAGRWLSSATTTQVKEAAALLNQGNLDEFRDFIGIGKGFWGWLFGKRKQKRLASVPVTPTTPQSTAPPVQPRAAARTEPVAPPAKRPTRSIQIRRQKRFDCHSKSYEGTKRLAVSPDGRILASAGGSSGGDIWLFDLTTGEQITTLEAHTYYGVTALTISPDSRRLMSTGDNNDGKVRVWSLPDGALLHDLKGNSYANRSVVVSPDGKLIAGAGGGDNAIRLWHMEDGTEFKILKGHAERVNHVAFTPDGRYLVSADDQGMVRIWSLPDGEMLVRCRTDASDGVKMLVVSPDSRYAVSGTHTHVRVWSIPDGKQVAAVERTFWIYSLGVSPDGKLLAAAGSSGDPGLWDMPTGRNLRELAGHKDEVTCLAFSPDGRFLASGSEDQDVILWSLPDGSRLMALEDHPGHVTSLAITPDSRTVVVGSKDGSVTLWSCTPEGADVPAPVRAATKPTAPPVQPRAAARTEPVAPPAKRPTWSIQFRRQKRFDCHSKSYEGTKRLAVSPDGRILASAGGSSGGDIWLFNLTTGEQITTLEAHTCFGVTALAISPDSRRLVSTGDSNDGKVRVWSLPDGALLHDLKGNSYANRSVVVSPDGKLIAGAGGGDNAVRLWHLEDGTEFNILKGHAEQVNHVAFTPDGRYLVSADNQGVVRIWSLPDGGMLRALPDRRQRRRADAGRLARRQVRGIRHPHPRPYLEHSGRETGRRSRATLLDPQPRRQPGRQAAGRSRQLGRPRPVGHADRPQPAGTEGTQG